MSPRSRDAMRPSFAFELHTPSRKRAQGRPGARCTRGLVRKVHQENAHEHTGSAETLRPSLRNGFTAYNGLSPVTGLFCHRRSREALAPQELDASVGASGPHDFAVRIGTLVSRTAASTASHPNVRDDGQRPSSGTGWRELVALICPTAKAKYFCRTGWTDFC